MGRVLVGMDTRESSPRLSQAVIDACHLLKVNVTNFGKVTTPMLHWYVQKDISVYKNKYHENFGQAYVDFMNLCDKASDHEEKKRYEPNLILDCSNGVGAASFKAIMETPGFEDRIKI